MIIYSPYKCGCWGDNIAGIWAAEYVKDKIPESLIIVDDTSCNEGRQSRYLDMSWADCIGGITAKAIHYTISTHHRHHVVKYDDSPKIFFDAHGLYLKFIYENWYPEFHPTYLTTKIFNNLKLPSEYNVLHLSKCAYGLRDKDSLEEFVKSNSWLIKKNTICTGYAIDGCLNLPSLPGWVKLYVMLRAENFYASQSGFTSIAAIYRQRKNSYLINYNPKGKKMAPPIACYTNCEIKNLDKIPWMYYWLETINLDYEKYCKNDLSVSLPIGMDIEDWPARFFADFNKVPEAPPENFHPKKVYFNIENCPVPKNLEMNYLDIQYE